MRIQRWIFRVSRVREIARFLVQLSPGQTIVVFAFYSDKAREAAGSERYGVL